MKSFMLVCLRKDLDLFVLELEKLGFVRDKSYGPVTWGKLEVIIRGEIPHDKLVEIKKLSNIISVWPDIQFGTCN